MLISKKKMFEKICRDFAIWETQISHTCIDDKTMTKYKKLFEKHPELLLYQNIDGKNLGMIAACYGLEQIVKLVLDNHKASVQQDYVSRNIGMYAAENELFEATLKALNHPYASVQQDKSGMNIGMYAVKNEMHKAVQKALENPETSQQIRKFAHDEGFILQDKKEKSQENDMSL